MMRIYAWDPGVIVAQFDRGGVPLMLTGVLKLTQITQPARAPIRDVYQQIYKDLLEAIQKAPTTGGPHRITTRCCICLICQSCALQQRLGKCIALCNRSN